MNNILLAIIFSILMLPGVVGVIIPMLPGVPYMFFIALIFGFINQFIDLSWLELLFLGILTAISFVVDYFSGLIGAKKGGATKAAMLFGFIGMIIGLLVFPPFGAIIGLFLGVFLAEFLVHKNHQKAFKAAGFSFFGSVTGILINLAISILFLVLFLLFVL